MDELHSRLPIGNRQSEIFSSHPSISHDGRESCAPATSADITDGVALSVHRLHHGRSKRPILEVIPDSTSTGLYRIAWPDIGLSETANLTRCKQAALEWAEQRFLTECRKMSGARRLKSLNNFWWSASPVRQNQNSDPCTGGEWITCPLEEGAP
jgi:hypothetical protein